MNERKILVLVIIILAVGIFSSNFQCITGKAVISSTIKTQGNSFESKDKVKIEINPGSKGIYPNKIALYRSSREKYGDISNICRSSTCKDYTIKEWIIPDTIQTGNYYLAIKERGTGRVVTSNIFYIKNTKIVVIPYGTHH